MLDTLISRYFRFSDPRPQDAPRPDPRRAGRIGREEERGGAGHHEEEEAGRGEGGRLQAAPGPLQARPGQTGGGEGEGEEGEGAAGGPGGDREEGRRGARPPLPLQGRLEICDNICEKFAMG